MTPGRSAVSRFSVGQQSDVARGEIVAIVLRKFVSTDALRQNDVIAVHRIKGRAVHAVRKKSQLRARAARLSDKVKLVGIREPREDQHLTALRMPVLENRGARLGITADLFRQVCWNRRDAVDDQALGWRDRFGWFGGDRVGSDKHGD